MSNKIEKSELELLQDINRKFAAIKHDLGSMVIRKSELLRGYDVTLEENNKVIKELEVKYGKVNINLEDGSYEDIKENE